MCKFWKVKWCWLALLCLAMAGCTISSSPGTKTPVSLSIQPTNLSLPLGLSQGFLAIAHLHDGTLTDVTTFTQWTSSNPVVATLDAKGVLKTLSPGTTTVKAVYGSLSASTGVTVGPAAIIAVDLNPANPGAIQVGDTINFTATGIMSDGSASKNITTQVKWASSNSNVASVSASGSASGDAVGVSVISATYGSGQNAPAGFVTLIVNPLLKSINVLPSSANIAENTNQQFTAIGVYSDGSTQDLTSQSSTQWACSPSGIASSINKGLAKVSTTTGTCNLTAAVTLSNGTTVTSSPAAALSVGNPALTALVATPAIPTEPIGVSLQFHATGQFGSAIQDLTSAPGMKWTSSNSAVAANPGGGRATTLAQGTTTITATFASTSAPSGLTVTNAKLSSISISAPLTQFAEGTTVQLKATGSFTDKSTQDLTNAVTWKSSAGAISVSSSGLLTGNTPGSATVTASLDGVSATTAKLQVNAETIKSIAITPGTATIAPGTTQPFTATVTFSNNTQQDITSLVQWNSSDPTSATIRDFGAGAGAATALAAGTPTISAVFGSVTASTSALTVTSAQPQTLSITANPSMTLGSSQQLKAIVTFSDSSTQDVTPLVTWSSDNIKAVVVTSTGLAVSAGSGSANITANFNSPLGTSASNSTAITVP